MANIPFSKNFSSQPFDNIFIKKSEASPTKTGVLNNLTFAVKDVIDIQNTKTSCGNPTWLSQQVAALANATCVQQLLDNGAKCIGKTVLGEFCSGSTGVNHFYGMPPNPKAPTRVPGGSSSGSASVVATGITDFSLGTDAAGSVRLPASFCGIYGLRPSTGVISMEGVKSFAPSFDTVGIFAREIETISNVFDVLAENVNESQAKTIDHFYVISDLMLLIPDEQRIALENFINESCDFLQLKPSYIKLTDIHPDADHPKLGMSAIFKKLLCAEIWATLGTWIKENNLQFKKDTYVDFSYMEQVSQTDLTEEAKRKKIYSDSLKNLLTPGSILCIPTAPNLPPLRSANYSKVNEFDYEKLRPLTCIASLGQLPQFNIPIESLGNPPLGVSLLAGHKQDYFLINAVNNMLKPY